VLPGVVFARNDGGTEKSGRTARGGRKRKQILRCAQDDSGRQEKWRRKEREKKRKRDSEAYVAGLRMTASDRKKRRRGTFAALSASASGAKEKAE